VTGTAKIQIVKSNKKLKYNVHTDTALYCRMENVFCFAIKEDATTKSKLLEILT